MKILVIDDSTTVLKRFSDILGQEGHQVILAEDGLEGVTLYEKERPDLIFIDIIMPDTLGDEVAHQILESNPTQKLVLISGDKTKKEEITRAFPHIPFLLKPFSAKEILDIITLISKR